MYSIVQGEFETYTGAKVPMWYRQDTTDENTIRFILQADEYLTHKPMGLRPGLTYVDIGAYIGAWGTLLQSLDPTCTVIAVEPLPENVELIYKNVPGAKVFPVAATGKGWRTMRIYYGQETKSELPFNFVGMPELYQRHGPERKYVEVECMTLDQLLAPVEEVAILKIDCEGAEYDIFKDAGEQTLAKIRYIVGEYHPFNAQLQSRKALLSLTRNLFTDITPDSYKTDSPLGYFWFKNKKAPIGLPNWR